MRPAVTRRRALPSRGLGATTEGPLAEIDVDQYDQSPMDGPAFACCSLTMRYSLRVVGQARPPTARGYAWDQPI